MKVFQVNNFTTTGAGQAPMAGGTQQQQQQQALLLPPVRQYEIIGPELTGPSAAAAAAGAAPAFGKVLPASQQLAGGGAGGFAGQQPMQGVKPAAAYPAQ